MRIILQTLLGIILGVVAWPLGQDPQYNAGLAQRQIAAEPVAEPEVTPIYHLLEDLTPAETSYLVQTTLLAAKGDVVVRVNLFDYLLAWSNTIDDLMERRPIHNFSAEWHRLLKSWAAKTSQKHILTGNAFLKALGQSPLAEEIVIFFMQEHLQQQLQDRLLTAALGQHPIWGKEEHLLSTDTAPSAPQAPSSATDLTCSMHQRWPQLQSWIEQVSQIRPRPLGGRSYAQLSGGSFLIKKYLPWRLWQWPLGNEENKIAPTISELWSTQRIGQQDLCTTFSNLAGQHALIDLGLSPLQDLVPPDHPTAAKRLQQYAAHPGKNLPTAYQIYCRKMLIPQIFQATPSLKDQKRHQLELQIALRDLER